MIVLLIIVWGLFYLNVRSFYKRRDLLEEIQKDLVKEFSKQYKYDPVVFKNVFKIK